MKALDMLILAQSEAIVHSTVENFTDVTDVEKVTAINYYSSVYCTYYALPLLKASKGQILAVSSIAGKDTVTLYL
jgi:NAD(P)-dependent dehydrogenase (short-subunit alcohol dehydrogenase family)